MKYKYKKNIRHSAANGGGLYAPDALDELDEVYEKAEAYHTNKAKIEAFDEVVKEHERNQSHADFREAVVMIIDDTQLIQEEQRL